MPCFRYFHRSRNKREDHSGDKAHLTKHHLSGSTTQILVFRILNPGGHGQGYRSWSSRSKTKSVISIRHFGQFEIIPPVNMKEDVELPLRAAIHHSEIRPACRDRERKYLLVRQNWPWWRRGERWFCMDFLRE